MKQPTDKELEDLRIATVTLFTPAISDWLTRTKGTNPQAAMAALTIFMGHALALAAVALGVDRQMDVDVAADIIAETTREQIAEISPTQGAMLQ